MKNLMKIRRARGLTQTDVAPLIGVTPGTISNWELGIIRPTAEHLAALAATFRVNSDWLLGVKGARMTNDVPVLRRVA